jgi:hypothetical protein
MISVSIEGESPGNGTGPYQGAHSGSEASPRIIPPCRFVNDHWLAKRGLSSKSEYQNRLAKRLHGKLLRPFICAICRCLALDPLGWSGPRLPLCEACADPVLSPWHGGVR